MVMPRYIAADILILHGKFQYCPIAQLAYMGALEFLPWRLAGGDRNFERRTARGDLFVSD